MIKDEIRNWQDCYTALYQCDLSGLLDPEDPGEMLYPLLSLGTSFPLGSPSENLDTLLRTGPIRVRRAVSEVAERRPSVLSKRSETGETADRASQSAPFLGPVTSSGL